MNYLIDKLGITYLSSHDQKEITFNYSFLIDEKNKLITKIKNSLCENTPITLFSWELDLLMLNTNPPTEEYINYYNYEELKILEILKKISLNQENITIEEIKKLYSLFRNNYIIENIINNSKNGIYLNPKELNILLSLIYNRNITIGTNILIYESLCKTLSLNVSKKYVLEKKIA